MSTITAPNPAPSSENPTLLGSYLSEKGALCEIRLLITTDGRRRVIDTSAGGDEIRLVGALFPEEPSGNAQLLCNTYLAERGYRRPCQRLTLADLDPDENVAETPEDLPAELSDGDGRRYRITTIEHPDGRHEAAWVCLLPGADLQSGEPITLRDVVGRLQNYEPAYAMTADAHEATRADLRLVTHELRRELDRLQASPIVLNRRLREVVLDRVARGEVSLSGIALRCGRVKRSSRAEWGDTSWLLRRIGQVPEGGQSQPTPWVHTDVLALIARDGLGISPCEVEL
jgi:hypothetical protein